MAETKLTPESAAVWRAIGQYTAAQAACLLLNLEPESDSLHDLSGAPLAMGTRIKERFNLTDPKQSRIFIDLDDPPPSRDELTLAQLESFAHEIGIHRALILSTNPPESPDADRLLAENAELKARIAMLEGERLEPDPRHRRTLLRIIAALMDQAKIDDAMPAKTAAHALNSVLEKTGRAMKADTIANVIEDAREVD